MENRELINGILDLTAENEKLKQQVALLEEKKSTQPKKGKGESEDIRANYMINILKRIAIKEIFYSWKLTESIVWVGTMRDEEGRNIEYKTERTFDEWFKKISIDYFNDKTYFSYCGVEEFKEFLKDELLLYYKKHLQEEIQKADKEVEPKTKS